MTNPIIVDEKVLSLLSKADQKTLRGLAAKGKAEAYKDTLEEMLDKKAKADAAKAEYMKRKDNFSYEIFSGQDANGQPNGQWYLGVRGNGVGRSANFTLEGIDRFLANTEALKAARAELATKLGK